MNKFLKKIAVVLSLAIVFAAMPMSVFAADVSDEAALRTAVAAGGEVVLQNDIALASALTVNGDVTLNLNGKTLTLPDHSNYGIVVKGKLTITGNGNVVVNGAYGIGTSTSCTGGLVIENGNFTQVNTGVYLIGHFGGTVEIKGGTFSAPYCVLNTFDGYTGTAVISGGTFAATTDSDPTASIILGTENTVSGGTYPADYDLTAYLAPGKVVNNGVVGDPAATGEAAPAATGEHVWGYNTQYDAAAHWDYCYVCGAQNTPVAHSDANGDGVCDCGWVLANTPSRVNPNTGVTADMLK